MYIFASHNDFEVVAIVRPRISVVKIPSSWCFPLEDCSFYRAIACHDLCGGPHGPETLLGQECYSTWSFTRSRALLSQELYSTRNSTRPGALLDRECYQAWGFTQPEAPSGPEPHWPYGGMLPCQMPHHQFTMCHKARRYFYH